MTVQIAGPVGPFIDRVQQRDVAVDVMAACEIQTNGPVGDPMQMQNHVQQQLLRAMREVIARKMDTRELTFQHLGTGNVAMVVPEIIAVSGLAQNGIMVNQLRMSFGIDGHPPPPLQGGAPMQQAPKDDFAKGTFDLGGGAQLKVKINGMTPENFAKNKASQMIWGWIIGAIIVVVMLIVFAGIGGYVWYTAKNSGASSVNDAKQAAAGAWDGKSTFECTGNDVVSLTNVKATAGVNAGGNCQLTMTGVSITAPVGIEAGGNAKVKMVGGSVTASTNSVVAGANAHVDFVGTTVSGKSKTSGAAKVTGAN
jgi:hypothetical protein